MSARRHLAGFVLIAALLLPAVVLSGADGSLGKLDRFLRQAHTQLAPDSTLSVIIRVKAGERTAVRRWLEARGAVIEAEHRVVNALTARVPVGELQHIAKVPTVESVSINAVVTGLAKKPGGGSGGTGGSGTPGGGVSGALRATLGLTDQSPTGSSVRVAIIDSGIEVNEDFNNRVLAFYDFVNGNGTFATPSDSYGHGTHIAGLIGSDGDLSGGEFKGVAPAARFVLLKVLGGDGSGQTSDVIEALEFATVNRSVLGIDVINLSLGHPIYEPAASDPLVQAVEAAVRAGIVVVVAGGNFGINPDTGQPGYAGISSPGNAPSAVTMGALKTNGTIRRSDDTVAPYSSRGPTWHDGFAKPDLVAPGHALTSNTSRGSYLFKNYPEFRYDARHMRLSGTSMATAVTAGTVALVIDAARKANPGGPSLPPNAVKAILQYTAFRMVDENGVEYDSLTQGAGALNAAGAVSLASAVNTSAPAGSWWLASGVEPSTVIAGEQLAWAQNIVWGTNIVWGMTVCTNEAAWAQNIVWGTNIVWSTNIVWGMNIVWGTNIVWSTNIVWGTGLVEADGANIVWGTLRNIVWGTSVWNSNIVWGMVVLTADGL